MISFTGLSASTDDQPLFENICITLDKGLLTCLTGPNGSGKTTLMDLISEQALHTGLNVQYLTQKQNETGLYSPGELRSKHVFQALSDACDYDLLLLDEPGNHMDRENSERFIRELRRLSRIPVLIITHERRLLRRANQILHLEKGNLEKYGGDYDLYRRQRSEHILARKNDVDAADKRAREAKRKLEKSIERQSKRQKHAEKLNKTQKNPKALVNACRNRADKTKARLENSHNRLKGIACQKSIEAQQELISEGRRFFIRLKSPKNLRSVPVIALHELNPRIPDHKGKKPFRYLFNTGLSFQLDSRERLAVTGRNGSGKTTLLNVIAGLHKEYTGQIVCGVQNLYYMRQIFTVQPLERVIDFHLNYISNFSEGELRIMLAVAGFTGESVFKRTDTLSGGEYCRLQLARASVANAEMLLLDEPTNDLDELARSELVKILKDTKIPYIIVSHDEEFLDELEISNRIRLD